MGCLVEGLYAQDGSRGYNQRDGLEQPSFILQDQAGRYLSRMLNL